MYNTLSADAQQMITVLVSHGTSVTQMGRHDVKPCSHCLLISSQLSCMT